MFLDTPTGKIKGSKELSVFQVLQEAESIAKYASVINKAQGIS